MGLESPISAALIALIGDVHHNLFNQLSLNCN